MTLDPRFVIASDLQSHFVDKDTGLPLAGGKLFFYQDISRATLKPIYEITGTPPNYSYTPVVNPITLGPGGNIVDGSGIDVILYYFPYDGTPATTTNIIDLYYVSAFNAGNVPQFTREGWPNTIAQANTSAANIKSYVPNGQFWLHNNLPGPPVGQVSQAITQIAAGGWTFERPSGSIAIDNLTFFRINQYVTFPSASPRYQVNITNTTPAPLDGFKDLRLKFFDVNKFASDTLQYTFFFTGLSLGAGPLVVGVYLIKNFGTGGDTPAATFLQNVTLPTSFPSTLFNVPITFGNNTGKNIGPNNDDFVQIAIRFPINATFSAGLTDFGLADGNVTVSAFPATPTSQFISQSSAGFLNTPAYTGADSYLPLMTTPYGQVADYSRIGTISASIYSSAYAINNNFPVLLTDGAGYIYNNYSSIGIPFSRLGNVLINDSPVTNTPKYGTGLNYATAYTYSTNTLFRISVNSTGTPIANAIDVTTGWTFKNTTIAVASVGVTAYSNTANAILGRMVTGAGFIGDGAPATGFTFVGLSGATGLTAFQPFAFTCTTVSGAVLANPGGPGRNFLLNNSAGGFFYVWYFFTNETDPAPVGRTGIKVDLSAIAAASYTAQDIANVTRETLNAFASTSILVTAIPAAGQSFNFQTNPGGSVINYYVWYTVGGVGVDPAPAARIGIKVVLNSIGETTATVLTKTLSAINQYQYAVPDFRGMFLRGFDPNGTWDLDIAQRWSTVTALSGAQLGTFEFQQFLFHNHNPVTIAIGGGITQFAGHPGVNEYGGAGNGGIFSPTFTGTATAAGGSETRPVNADVNYFIYY